MSGLHNSCASLWSALGTAGDVSGRFISASDRTVTFGDVIRESVLGRDGEALRGRSVLAWTRSQVTGALALIDLAGIARRIVLCPSDFPLRHFAYLIDSGEVEAIVSDQPVPEAGIPVVDCGRKNVPGLLDRSPSHDTEWVLLTSGTTARPKMVVHTLTNLTAAIERRTHVEGPIVWSTFYNIFRYGGLQIFLRAVLTGTSLVLTSTDESTADFLAMAGTKKITHISGTPSHWRGALMSPAAHEITPKYIRLSGEIADQALLSKLQSFYPQAKVAHAFASTEAGVAFEVMDGLSGFPASFVGRNSEIEMKVQDGSLRIRSSRNGSRYLGDEDKRLKDADGFVDTGDVLELQGGRYYFAGRRDGVINVGGLKVHPEEVEAVVNHHPKVQASLVRARKNPITGALVIADVLLNEAPDLEAPELHALQQEILLLCRTALPSHKIPAAINFVPALAVAKTGKLLRRHA